MSTFIPPKNRKKNTRKTTKNKDKKQKKTRKKRAQKKTRKKKKQGKEGQGPVKGKFLEPPSRRIPCGPELRACPAESDQPSGIELTRSWDKKNPHFKQSFCDFWRLLPLWPVRDTPARAIAEGRSQQEKISLLSCSIAQVSLRHSLCTRGVTPRVGTVERGISHPIFSLQINSKTISVR